MTLFETYCTDCGKTVQDETDHCPNCGAADPWDERPAHKFSDDDLPLVFSHEIYQDHGELWRSFASDYFGSAEVTEIQAAGIPDEFPRLEYCIFDIYYVVTEGLELQGPFLQRSAAREAATSEVEA